MEGAIKAQGKVIMDVPGDGNCLLHALFFGQSNPLMISLIRNALSQEMDSHPESYYEMVVAEMGGLLGNFWQDWKLWYRFLEELRTPGIAMSILSILPFQTLFNTRVVVYFLNQLGSLCQYDFQGTGELIEIAWIRSSNEKEGLNHYVRVFNQEEAASQVRYLNLAIEEPEREQKKPRLSNMLAGLMVTNWVNVFEGKKLPQLESDWRQQLHDPLCLSWVDGDLEKATYSAILVIY